MKGPASQSDIILDNRLRTACKTADFLITVTEYQHGKLGTTIETQTLNRIVDLNHLTALQRRHGIVGTGKDPGIMRFYAVGAGKRMMGTLAKIVERILHDSENPGLEISVGREAMSILQNLKVGILKKVESIIMIGSETQSKSEK